MIKFSILLLNVFLISSCGLTVSNKEVIEQAKADIKNERASNLFSIIDTMRVVATNCNDSNKFNSTEYDIIVFPKRSNDVSVAPKNACSAGSVSKNAREQLFDLMKGYVSIIMVRDNRLTFSFKREDNFTANKQYKITFYKKNMNLRERYKDYEITSCDTIPKTDKWVYILNDTTVIYRKPK